MARYNQRSVIQAISAPQTVGVVMSADTGTGFTKYPSDATPAILPTRALVADNAVGDGKAYPKQSKPYYFSPINIPYSMALNSTMGQILLRMWLGGALTNASAVNVTISQAIAQKAPGAVPMVANVIDSLGGASNLFADCFVQTISISQAGSGEPKITAQLMNSGHFTPVSGTSIVLANVVDMPAYKRYHGAKTRLTFSDGSTTYNFATVGTLIDVSFDGNQNVQVEELPGDSFQDSTKQCQGAIANNFFIDVQTASIKAKVYMDASFAIFAQWLANVVLTNIVLTFYTCEFIGTGSVQFSEYEITMAKGEFNLQGDSQNNFSAYSFTINGIIGDTTSGNLVSGRVRRDTADIFTV